MFNGPSTGLYYGWEIFSPASTVALARLKPMSTSDGYEPIPATYSSPPSTLSSSLCSCTILPSSSSRSFSTKSSTFLFAGMSFTHIAVRYASISLLSIYISFFFLFYLICSYSLGVVFSKRSLIGFWLSLPCMLSISSIFSPSLISSLKLKPLLRPYRRSSFLEPFGLYSPSCLNLLLLNWEPGFGSISNSSSPISLRLPSCGLLSPLRIYEPLLWSVLLDC